MTPPPLRRLRWRAEAALVAALFALCRALGPVRASDLGGFLARSIGPWLPVSRVAAVNLRLAFPDRDAAFRRAALRAAWDNLGRVGGELPHLPRLLADPAAWRVEGEAHLAPLRAMGGPAILVSGHFGNFEMIPGVAARAGVGIALVYRAIGNPLIDAMIRRLRADAVADPRLPLVPKGPAGARALLGWLRQGGLVGMLADQKMNDGIAAPLFGRTAMTAPAAAHLALRLRCPLLPARCVREGPARFRIVVDPPLALPDTGDRQADTAVLTAAINASIERWVREQPGQWLWLHRRFEKQLYRAQ
jgi:KDO2-lipid IV(A) lauroyltransferase